VSERRRRTSEPERPVPTKRELQEPIQSGSGQDRTWLSPEDDEPDARREEAAERAKRAVEPGRDRE
jgi:hypothetical protein